MKKPTRAEILKAREVIDEMPSDDVYEIEETLGCWQGKGWHHVDIAYGILVGLQIAENRNGGLKLVGG